MIQPRNDRVLIRRIEEPEAKIGSIIVPDVAREKALKGEVLAVGPGKWEEGCWWKVRHTSTNIEADREHFKMTTTPAYEWEWIEGHRVPPEVHPGQIVLFSSKWNDLSSTHYDDDKAALFDPLLHLVQEADILGITN